MVDLTDEQVERIREQIDDLIERVSDVLEGEQHGIILSVFGHLIGTQANDWVDLVRRCNAISEMAAITFLGENAPTEH